jgi:hypothetical protein
LLDPGLVGGPLDTGGGPVPSILCLNDVESLIEPKSHSAVSATGSGTVHDHRVKTIKTHDHKEVTGMNLGFRHVNFIDGSGFNFEAHTSFDEVDIGLFHVGRSVAANPWNIRVKRQSTDESLKSVEDTNEGIFETTTEMPHLETTESKIDLSILRNFERDRVSAFEVE